MLSHFLQYQIELLGVQENDLTENLVKQLNNDFEKRNGIYNKLFGDTCEMAVHGDRGNLILCGCIFANSERECKTVFTMLKLEVMKIFKNCNKINDLFVGTGDKVF